MTFSIAARCQRTGQFAVAVSSSSPAVAARCAHARAGVGAVLSQNVTDPRLGARTLDLLERGATAEEACAIVMRGAGAPAFRQLLVVDRHGGVAQWSGERSLGINASARGPGVVAAGNMLASPAVPDAMVMAFANADPADELGARVLGAMRAGLAAGGEAGPVHSAGLVVVATEAWPIADLRVDWTEGNPIDALSGLWDLWAPQMHDYVTRALNPDAAPSYGVPGDPGGEPG